MQSSSPSSHSQTYIELLEHGAVLERPRYVAGVQLVVPQTKAGELGQVTWGSRSTTSWCWSHTLGVAARQQSLGLGGQEISQ